MKNHIVRKTFQVVLCVGLALVIGVLNHPGSAHAAGYFVVNSDADLVDSNPGDGICNTIGNKCTLRAAIMEANRDADTISNPTIIIPAGIFVLTIPTSGNFSDDATGSIKIKRGMDLIGAGADFLFIGDPRTSINGNGAVTHDCVVFTGSNPGPSSAVITISNVFIAGGKCNYGGGILNNAVLTINNSIVAYNFARPGGGGIANFGGTLTVNNSQIWHNATTNQGSRGGGIMNDDGSTYVFNSTIYENSSAGYGGGIQNSVGAVRVRNSEISYNGAGIDGGGIQSDGAGTVWLENSTVSQNVANRDGGGILNNNATLSLLNSTVAYNKADVDLNFVGMGGGVYSAVGAAATLRNTIVANNSESLRFLGNVLPSDGDCAGVITLSSYSLMMNYDTTHCTVTGNLTLADPKLGPLQNNGGTTRTHALLSGSPAIDLSEPTGCKDYDGLILPTDQRGMPRQMGARCDMGAYESGWQVFLPLTLR